MNRGIRTFAPLLLASFVRTSVFMGADTGGNRAAIIYSLIGTAKLNNLNPAAYLRNVLACIADYPLTSSPP